MFSELRREVIVCFVDIGGIDDHYCLNFHFCVQWVKMKGDWFFLLILVELMTITV